MRSRKPTLEDVAAIAGVSQATISRLLNGHTEVCTPETAQRIYDAIATLGYVPPVKRTRPGRGKPSLAETSNTGSENENDGGTTEFRTEETTSLITRK
ncbi:MAG: LacI family DNA-binding transcriptional regulator [Capsulimonadales bacterium]|nr:LacI family DNA-binding transcriptional regulator [Capsulimonadales bacterium]